MSLHEDLRRQARHLATKERRRPLQASLRRAISSGYYALFHLLISEATEQMLHTGASARQFRHVLGRAFSHESMVKACKSFHGGTLPAVVTETAGSVTVPPDLQTVAGIFVELQEMRHPADYDLGRQFSRGDVLTLLDKLDDAFEAWRRVRIVPIARFFLALLPLWDKVARR